MKRSTTSGGTRQKSYVTPVTKRTFMRLLSESYPMAAIAEEETRTISMSSPFDSDVVWKLHSIGMRLLANLAVLCGIACRSRIEEAA